MEKKKKPFINWGWAIVIAFIGFGAFIITLVVGTYGERVDLIEENYYEAEIRYQSRMEEMQRTENMAEKPHLVQEGKYLSIILPGGENTKGTARFLRPDNANFDFEVPVISGKNPVGTDKILPGNWIIHLEWETDGEIYYQKLTHYF
ncbi:MAG: FixH family protein [Cryomorphaceae bacterium]|nr:FixH family protein [Cryomorphaceae bacterium]